jgi:hypothetical protein
VSLQAVVWVLEHSKAEHAARLVLISLANHTNDRHEAYPSIATMCEEALLSERAVRSALRRLEALHEIASAGKHPKYRTTIYLFGMGADSAPMPNSVGAKQVADSAPEPKATGVKGSLERSSSSVSSFLEFEQFWNVFPRKVGKRAARAAFGRAVKRASVGEILAGAQRYHLDPNREMAFTAHPTTWLNRDSWGDELLPARSKSVSSEIDRRLAEEGAQTWRPSKSAIRQS